MNEQFSDEKASSMVWSDTISFMLLTHGFWQLYDADVYATGRLGWDVDTDVGAATRDWVARELSDDPATVETLMQVLADSREAVRDGLYIAPYAREQVLAARDAYDARILADA